MAVSCFILLNLGFKRDKMLKGAFKWSLLTCCLSAGKCISAVMLTLKTVKGMKTLRLAPQLHDSLQKEKVRVGDVVFIEANTGEKQKELKPLLNTSISHPRILASTRPQGPPFGAL